MNLFISLLFVNIAMKERSFEATEGKLARDSCVRLKAGKEEFKMKMEASKIKLKIKCNQKTMRS